MSGFLIEEQFYSISDQRTSMEGHLIEKVSPRRVLLGADSTTTRWAFFIAGILLLFGLAVDYLWMSAYVSRGNQGLTFTRTLAQILAFRWGYGALLLIGIAAVHGYFNIGLLPSLTLASAPFVGGALLSLNPSDTRVLLTSGMVPYRVLPEILIFPFAGFVLGVGLRWLRRNGGSSLTGKSNFSQ